MCGEGVGHGLQKSKTKLSDLLELDDFRHTPVLFSSLTILMSLHTSYGV